jgi:hypothetical protein
MTIDSLKVESGKRRREKMRKRPTVETDMAVAAALF